jgi:hypothetical protein
MGKIYMINKKGHAVFTVNFINDLNNVIISHFIKYPLLIQKKVDFLLFKTILELMKAKKHLTNQDLTEIIHIKVSMYKDITFLLYNNL